MDEPAEIKDQALEAAKVFAEIAAVFPKGEAAWIICVNAERQLRKRYGLTPDQRRARVLRFIGDGYLSIDELCKGLWYSRRDVQALLKDLIAAGYVIERLEPPIGGIGRPRRTYRMSESSDFFTSKK